MDGLGSGLAYWRGRGGGVETGGQLYIKEKLKHTNNVVDVLSKKF